MKHAIALVLVMLAAACAPQADYNPPPAVDGRGGTECAFCQRLYEMALIECRDYGQSTGSCLAGKGYFTPEASCAQTCRAAR
jgi:hypothetical protein